MSRHLSTQGAHPSSPTRYPAAPTLLEMNRALSDGAAEWDASEACPVCGSRRIRDFAVIRCFRHSRCGDCGLTFVNPSPPPEILHAFYNSDSYANYRRAESDRARTDPYYSISMYTDARSLATRVVGRAPRSVLDYGCGTGAFLALLRDEYGVADVEGLEIGELAREVAMSRHSLDVARTPGDLRRDVYDFVLLLEVVEHVPDPVALLASVAARVPAGGHVMITTPAVDNFIGRRAQLCTHYTAPGHLTLFTAKALRVLLERSGFEEVETTIDRPWATARPLATSLVCRLDFASPRDEDDVNDAWYRPNALGHLMGLQAGRDPLLDHRLLWLLRRAAGGADRILRRLPLGTDHLYVVARRSEASEAATTPSA